MFHEWRKFVGYDNDGLLNALIEGIVGGIRPSRAAVCWLGEEIERFMCG